MTIWCMAQGDLTRALDFDNRVGLCVRYMKMWAGGGPPVLTWGEGGLGFGAEG